METENNDAQNLITSSKMEIENNDTQNAVISDNTTTETSNQVVNSDDETNRPPKKTWGNNNNTLECYQQREKPVSLTSIMESETVKKRLENDEKKEMELEVENNDMILALQQSLEEVSTNQSEEEEIMKAIAISLQQQQPENSSLIEKGKIELALRDSSEGGAAVPAAPKSAPTVAAAAAPIAAAPTSVAQSSAAAAAAPNNSEEETNFSSLEREEIEQALRLADEEEASRSFHLALQLQEEEEEAARSSVSKQSQGNVRLMTQNQFREEMSDKALSSGNHRELYGADSSLIVEEPEDDVGFRMNSKSSSGSWSRVDGSTIVGPNNELRTKHDIELQGQANAQRLGLDFSNYDDMDQKPASVGNKAFNSFRHSMQKKTVKGVMAHGHGRAAQDTNRTRGGAMDPRVRLQISKAINNSLIDRCNGVVKEGKEAIVYHAEEGEKSEGFDVAIKVFKRIQEFKQRGMYVDGDPRYLRNKFSQASTREKLEIWTEKEFRNLVRANRAGVPVPTPLLYKENILFLRFLGEDGFPSPQLRELQLKPRSKKWTVLYEQTMAAVRLLYQKSRLVHADLSEYNVLVCPCRLVENSILKEQDDNNDENALQIVLIDFGQAVDVRHLNAMEFLRRDLLRLKEFFDKKGVTTTMKLDVAEEFVTQTDTESEENSLNENEVDTSGFTTQSKAIDA